MRPESDHYWFHAKRYGWGWGLPASWQGWVVLAIWIGMLFVAVYELRQQHPLVFAAVLGGSTALYSWICYKTGEPPKWRWGGDD